MVLQKEQKACKYFHATSSYSHPLSKARFRWAVCQIDILHRLRTISDVRNALSNLPKTLDDTNNRIFELIAEEDRPFVKRALIFILGTNEVLDRPITSTVLLKAVLHRFPKGGSRTRRNSRTNREDHGDGLSPFTIESLYDTCGCLVSFSTTDGTEHARLAHYTVQEFLFSGRILQRLAWPFVMNHQNIGDVFMDMALSVVVENKRLLTPVSGLSMLETINPNEDVIRTYRDSLICYCILIVEVVFQRRFSTDSWQIDAQQCITLTGEQTSTYKDLTSGCETGRWFERNLRRIVALEAGSGGDCELMNGTIYL